MGDEDWDDGDTSATTFSLAPTSNGNSDGWDNGQSSSSSLGGGFGRGFSGGFGGGIAGGKDADDAGTSGGGYGGFGRGKSSGGFGGGKVGGSSGGSGCRICGEDGHFARECPNKGQSSGGGGSGCHKCGEDGHFARECPNKGQSSGGGGSGCHKCGEDGHFARECPNNQSSGGGGSGCHKCGEDGHFARDCPNKGPDTCRKCGETGHFARDCTNEDANGVNEDGTPKPAPVTYVPPDPSEEEQEVFRTIAQGLNFDKYDEIPVEVTGNGKMPQPIKTFEQGNLYEAFLVNVRRAKYLKPTPVQKYAIPIIYAGRDLMACAQTGSGKTAAFLLPVLSKMMEDGLTGSRFSEIQAPAALIISPTRELTVQINMEARKFSYQTSVRPVVCYGGVSVAHQLRQIENGCHMLVATPGRLKDFVERRKISLEGVKYLILDEADRMLDMGFLPAIKSIVNDFNMPSKDGRQTLMFSATFPEEIQNLAAEFLNDYVFLTIGKVGGTSSDIEQVIEELPESEKRDRLIEILSSEGANKNLVFVETKRSADFLASLLSQNGFPTTSIHGDRFQQQREEALRDFRSGRCSVLVATAVAARGLDIEDVKQVVNYDLPQEIDEYVHRIGRTGRIGNQGRAISFFSKGKDEGLARSLVKVLSDANQVVPDWLEEVAETALGTGYGAKGGGKYGGKDTRNFSKSNNDDFSNGGTSSFTNGGGGFGDSGGGGDEEW
ncbi:uncharacterized protein LOC135694609 [Rhopilema esculentum]|uniref:uncharacterized protein LOC135694609 n=1 Tax=Rhopilema esculentum TaxID=499914 RepID=UPI0031D3884D|eukprot:gene4304-20504_t